MKNRKSGKRPAGAAGCFIYLGPTITGCITHGAIYRGSKSDVMKLLSRVVERYPSIGTLIVSSETLAEDRIKVKIPGNALYENYQKLLSGRK